MTEATILVVEDNERNRKLVRDVLQFAGFDVVAAETAERGIDLALQCPPDLILMDLQLPGMDGVEAMHQLRTASRTSTVPIVAVTAQAMKDDRRLALAAGFDGYIEKPISVPALPEQVRSYLQPHEEAAT